ncbi:MAG: DUF2116 family Zn-ribbon domain-containing protein [Synergistaceae bacterium]|nr:DUF2116 family Zn-ribbon domain-containing protein [Synergistaceae bacterium]
MEYYHTRIINVKYSHCPVASNPHPSGESLCSCKHSLNPDTSRVRKGAIIFPSGFG